MKKILSIMLFCLCFASSVYATNLLEGLGMWTNWNNKETLSGLSDVSMGFNSQEFTDYLVHGSNFQPLIADLDEDGTNEIFVTSGSYLMALTFDGANLAVESQLLLPYTQSYQASIGSKSSDRVIVLPLSYYLYTYSYDGSVFTQEQVYNTSANNVTIISGLTCRGTGTTGNFCAFGATNRYAQYYLDTNTVTSSHVGMQCTGQPAISSSFSGTRTAITCGGYGIKVMETTGGLATVLSIPVANVCHGTINKLLGGIAFYDIDGGSQELIVTCSSCASGSVNNMGLFAVDSTGTTIRDYDGTWQHSGGSCNVDMKSTVLGGRFTANQRQVCSWANNDGVESIRCYNADSMARVYNKSLGADRISIIAADANNDGFDDLIDGYNIYFPKTKTNVTLNTNTGGYLAVGDLNGNNLAEIISSKYGKTYVSTGNIVSGFNVTIVVSDYSDGTPIGGATVFVDGILYTTNQNGNAYILVSSLDSHIVNVTAFGYNDWRDSSVDFSLGTNTLTLSKPIYSTIVFDSVYSATFFDNFTSSRNISHDGWYSNGLNYMNSEGKQGVAYQNYGKTLAVNATSGGITYVHNTYLSTDQAEILFHLKPSESCDGGSCPRFADADGITFAMKDFSNNVAAQFRVWYNQTGAHQKYFVDYYNGAWVNCFRTAPTNTPLVFKAVLQSGAYSLFIYNDSNPAHFVFPIGTVDWNSCVENESFINNNVSVVDLVQFVPQQMNSGTHYIDYFTAGERVGVGCDENQPPSITSIAYSTGSPICFNETQDYSITINDPENDFVSVNVDCYGNDSWGGWTILAQLAHGITVYPCYYGKTGTFTARFLVTDLCNFPYPTNNASFVQQVRSTTCYSRGEGQPSAGGDYTVPSSDLCNQFYYDPSTDSWKYSSSRCDALEAGHSGVWNMGSNLFRWGVANLGQWVLTNVFYFIMLLLLFILLMPVILKWRESSGNNRR